MIRGGFLSDAERPALTAMARDGLAEHRIARRANAIVLLDKGWSCARVAGALLLDDDTVRDWFQAYESGGLDALSRFGHEGSSCRLPLEQQAALQNWITVRLPRSTRTIGAWLEKNHGFNYSRPGLIALLHRLGFDYRKPHKMPRGLKMSGSRPSSQATRSFSTPWLRMRRWCSSMPSIPRIRYGPRDVGRRRTLRSLSNKRPGAKI